MFSKTDQFQSYFSKTDYSQNRYYNRDLTYHRFYRGKLWSGINLRSLSTPTNITHFDFKISSIFGSVGDLTAKYQIKLKIYFHEIIN